MFIKKFSFTADSDSNISVKAKDMYSAETGYGFIPFIAEFNNTADKFITGGGWKPGKDIYQPS